MYFFFLFSHLMPCANWTCWTAGCVPGCVVAGHPLPRGHELPCHLVVWRSVRRRIITIPQRWLTSMIWDRLSNREYTYVMVLTWETEKKPNPDVYVVKFTENRLFLREEFCEIFRAKDRNTLRMYTCKKFHKKDGRKVRKAAKNEIMILNM